MEFHPADVFEFLLVLVTVIVSLGIAELLGGVVRVLRHELKPGHLHWLWVWLVFNMQIQWLWFCWNFRDRGSWLFPEVMLLIAPPILLYMSSAVLFPNTLAEDGDPASITNAFRLVLIGMCIGLIFTARRGIHWAFALAILVAQLWWVYHYSFAI